MVNIAHFEKTLKAKWLKQLLSSTGGWTIIPCKYGIHNCPSYGPDYPCFLINKIRNPFWKSVLEAVKSFQEIFDANNLPLFLFMIPFGLIH